MIKSIFEDEETEVANLPSVESGVEERVVSGRKKKKKDESENESKAGPSTKRRIAPVKTKSKESDLEKQLADIKAELASLKDRDSDRGNEEATVAADESVSTPKHEKLPIASVTSGLGLEDDHSGGEPATAGMSPAEALRNSGLAYSAAIALFGSIIFMLILGWFADLLLGIKPWGTLIGIAIGSLIGFFQFFRITSRIFGSKADDFAKVSLLAPESLPLDDEESSAVPESGPSAADSKGAASAADVLETISGDASKSDDKPDPGVS